MKKYQLFEGEINAEIVSAMLSFVNENDGDLVIGFESIGGPNQYMRMVLMCLNENSSRITLCAVHAICSSAFELFHLFKGKRQMALGCIGMYHFSTSDVTYGVDGKPINGQGVVQMETLKEYRKFQKWFSEGIMNEDELKKFNMGEDVWFGPSRMTQIFKNAEIV